MVHIVHDVSKYKNLQRCNDTMPKYLCVMIDENLKWKSHVDPINSKLRKILFMFKELLFVSFKSCSGLSHFD